MPTPRLVVTRLADVVVVERTWLFKPYIALGEVTALAGDGGIGKTTLLKAIATGVTLGREPWTGEARDPADVLIMFGEDDLAEGVKGDMERMGADTLRVHCIEGILIEDEAEGWRLDEEGFECLLREVERLSPALVALDPILEIVPEHVDLNKAHDVRAMLKPLRYLARNHNCAVMFTIHLSKVGNGRAQSRIQGSVDFVNFVRSALMVGQDPDDPGNRLLTHAKTNLGKPGDTLAWSYDPAGEFCWVGPVDVPADAVFAPLPKLESHEQQAEQWLLEHHTQRAQPKAEVVAEAGGAGISQRALEDAYRALGGRAKAVYIEGHRGAHHWDWPPIGPEGFTLTTSTQGNGGSKSQGRGDTEEPSIDGENGHQEGEVDLLSGFTRDVSTGVNAVIAPSRCASCGLVYVILPDGTARPCDCGGISS